MTQDAVVFLLRDIEALEPDVAAAVLARHSAEDIQDVLRALPADRASAIVACLPDATPTPMMDAENALVAEEVAGDVAAVMLPATGVLPGTTTVAGALDYLVHTTPANTVTYVYVVDDDQRLTGVVAMRDLLLASPAQRLADVMTPAPFTFAPETPVRDAIRVALDKRHRIYPVVSGEGQLVGMVYGWQLFERMATEISGQSGAMVGVDREERIDTAIWPAFLMRHPWLQVNLVTAFGAALVVGLFEDTIAQVVVLAAFLPVLAGQSGNTGCQTLAITLRGLTLGQLADYPMTRLLRKELVLGAMNGLFVGVVAAAGMWAYATMSGTAAPLQLALVVLVSMVGACVGSGLFGVMVPLTLKRFGADPAMASSIFLTTFTDILGMGLMLLLATLVLL